MLISWNGTSINAVDAMRKLLNGLCSVAWENTGPILWQQFGLMFCALYSACFPCNYWEHPDCGGKSQEFLFTALNLELPDGACSLLRDSMSSAFDCFTGLWQRRARC